MTRKTATKASAKTPAPAPRKRKAHHQLNDDDTLRLWVAAAGRCELCADPVGFSTTTFRELNLAERAHIIGQGEGEKSPRYDPVLSPKLGASIENVMLLCRPCHKEIDSPKTRGKYPTELLLEKKQLHEERIKFLTSLKAKRTRVVAFTTRIQQSAGGAQSPTTLHRDDMHEAILPDYFPDQHDPTRINVDLPTEESPAHWDQLRRKIARDWERLIEDDVQHLSVFSFGKMPAVMELGRRIGDARKVRPMNVRQGVATSWLKREQVPTQFKLEVSNSPAQAATDVLLLLSLSGQIEPQQYREVVPEGCPVFEITHSGVADPTEQYRPGNDWLIAEGQLREFTEAYRKMLTRITQVHGQGATIHLIAAAPTPVLLEVGRHYRPNQHPRMLIYNCVGRQFNAAFYLGEEL